MEITFERRCTKLNEHKFFHQSLTSDLFGHTTIQISKGRYGEQKVTVIRGFEDRSQGLSDFWRLASLRVRHGYDIKSYVLDVSDEKTLTQIRLSSGRRSQRYFDNRAARLILESALSAVQGTPDQFEYAPPIRKCLELLTEQSSSREKASSFGQLDIDFVESDLMEASLRSDDPFLKSLELLTFHLLNNSPRHRSGILNALNLPRTIDTSNVTFIDNHRVSAGLRLRTPIIAAFMTRSVRPDIGMRLARYGYETVNCLLTVTQKDLIKSARLTPSELSEVQRVCSAFGQQIGSRVQVHRKDQPAEDRTSGPNSGISSTC